MLSQGLQSLSFSSSQVPQKNKEWIVLLKETILNNLNHPKFHGDFLGEKMNISRRHLQRRVKEITGKTPLVLVKDIKMAEALRLINTKEINSVKELSFRLGFSNVEYFSGLFKAHYGKNPSAYLYRKHLTPLASEIRFKILE